MVVLLNGSFGIGKTTVAALVAQMLPGTGVFNPEPPGVVIQRAFRVAGRHVEDFQDVPLWRRLTSLGIRIATKINKHVVVPMAFSNVSYLRELQASVARFEPQLIHLCLVASVATVHERLLLRGADPGDPRSAWQYRRAIECCLVHPDSAFAEHVSAETMTAHEIASLVVKRMHTP